MRFKQNRKFTLLISVSPKTKFVSAKHPSLPFLVLDVFAHGRGADISDCASIITAAPESWEPGAKRGELLAKHSARVPFKPVSDLSHRPCRIALDKEMHVIRHDLQHVNCHLKFVGFFFDKLTKTHRDSIDQNWTPVFRAPDKVKLQAEDCADIFRVPFVSQFHTLTRRQISMQLKSTLLPERHSPAT